MPPGRAANGNTTLNAFFSKASQQKSSQGTDAASSSQGEKSQKTSLATKKAESSGKSTKSSQAKSTPATSNGSSKRKSIVVDSDEEETSPPRKKTAVQSKTDGSPKAKKPAPSTKPVAVSTDDEDRQASSTSKTLSKTKPRASASPKKINEKTPSPDKSAPKPRKSNRIESSESEDEKPPTKKPRSPAKASTSTSKKNMAPLELSDSEEEEPPAKKPRSPVKPTASTSKSKASPSKSEDAKRASPSKEDKPAAAEGPPKAKFDWAAKAKRLAAGPPAHGSKPIPDGAPNCLAGLAFVFTGELSAFSRDEAQELVKRFGGRVTGQPSSKTSYVVLGAESGASKLAAIKKHGLTTLDEDGLLDLIRTRPCVMDEKTKKKMEEEDKKVKQAAKEMEKREKQAEKKGLAIDLSSQLWTSKYAPRNLKEICGNKGQVEKLQRWLHDWPANLKSGFKKAGKDMTGAYRAMLISGPPGIGKTTSAHLCAQLEGYTAIELNASDTRSKKLLENAANINNTSLDGFLAGDKKTNIAGVEITNRTVLILDEVDGMSAGDRGGIGAMNQLIKKTKIPIICIANDRSLQKMKPLQGTTFNLSFRRPEPNQIRSRIKSIAFKEKLDIPANVIDQLVQGTQSDIRQVLNILSTWKLSHNSMDFDEGKAVVRDSEKYSVMTPFNVSAKILGPYLFANTARETLGEKMEYYFHDMQLVPLFIQENYLRTQPAKLRNHEGSELAMKQLQLMDKAARSISDGDLVDALIHGSEQHWTLLPLHSVVSTIRPASHIYGAGGGWGGAASFPAWLGQNSKQNKLQRQLNDIQVRMRLVVTGDKSQIRQSYIPALHPKLVLPLTDIGASAVPDVIEAMDQYYLSKDDWDALVELGVGDNNEEAILKKISTATKTHFTKKYNSTEHPIAFHKATDLGKAPKKLGGGPAPDHEDVFDVDEDVEEEKEEKKEDEITKDKLIKEAKPKGKGKASKANG